MRHIELHDGIHLLSRWSKEKVGVNHYAVGVVGVAGRTLGFDRPVVIELSPGGWTIDRWVGTAGWRLCATARNEAQAGQRLRALLAANSRYDVVQNNCEHVARFVVLGISESWQVQGVLAVILAAGVLGAVAVSARRA